MNGIDGTVAHRHPHRLVVEDDHEIVDSTEPQVSNSKNESDVPMSKSLQPVIHKCRHTAQNLASDGSNRRTKSQYIKTNKDANYRGITAQSITA
jgi:hypothetical protein